MRVQAIVRDLEQAFAPAKLSSLSTSLREAAMKQELLDISTARRSAGPVAQRDFGLDREGPGHKVCTHPASCQIIV